MKASKARKVKTHNSRYMTEEAFADFRQALEDALDFERRQRRGLNVTRIQVHKVESSRIRSRASAKGELLKDGKDYDAYH